MPEVPMPEVPMPITSPLNQVREVIHEADHVLDQSITAMMGACSNLHYLFQYLDKLPTEDRQRTLVNMQQRCIEVRDQMELACSLAMKIRGFKL